MIRSAKPNRASGWLLFAIALLVTTIVYWPGLSGNFLFDDYPNIVDNQGVQPQDASVSSLVRAALSSPSSKFKRPLASLSFAANYLATGLDPYWMKLTNLVIHLLNGLLVFLLARGLLQCTPGRQRHPAVVGATSVAMLSAKFGDQSIATEVAPTDVAPAQTTSQHCGIVAALIAAGWMLLPINLTGVLYVVQRMESMANLFVLLGLIGYVAGRRRMLQPRGDATGSFAPSPARKGGLGWGGFWLCVVSVTVPTVLGLLAKETAVMLPLYALLIEWVVFRWRRPSLSTRDDNVSATENGAEADDSSIRESAALTESIARERAPTTGESPLWTGARNASWLAAWWQRVVGGSAGSMRSSEPAKDWRIIGLFLVVLLLPMIIGLTWLLPGLFHPATWATRDFTMTTRLLSEARIVVDYIVWTLLPTPGALSFYHDDFLISSGLLAPWTTLVSILVLASLLVLMLWLRRRVPLAALGLALFFGCQLLTGTVIPLELIYEHRNYFASFGLLLAIIPLLAAPPRRETNARSPTRESLDASSAPCPQGTSCGRRSDFSRDALAANPKSENKNIAAEAAPTSATRSTHCSLPPADAPPSGTSDFRRDALAAEPKSIAAEAAPTTAGNPLWTTSGEGLPFALPRYVLLGGLFLMWTMLTAFTAYTWGNPLRLAEDLATRAPQSPRAQYELGRTYIIYSHYDPTSPFTPLVYAPLEKAAALPDASILPEQALIFMNARMHRPLKDAWWDSMIAKLKAHKPGVQDESSLGALTQCAREHKCDLPPQRMMAAFMAALSHPNPRPRLLATYGDYAWNVLGDHHLGLRMTQEAVKAKPDEPAYQITLIRMLAVLGRYDEARKAMQQLATLNIGGRLDSRLHELRALLP